MIQKHLPLLFCFALIFPFGLKAEKTIPQDPPSFSLKHYTAYSPSKSSFISQISRMDLTYTYPGKFFEITLSPDLDIDYTGGAEAVFSPTEYYADVYLNRADLRIGRQSFSWGASPLQSIHNFLTPVILTEFLLPDAEDLTDARLAASVYYYFDSDYLQLIYAPRTRASELPPLESEWFPAQTVPSFVDLNFVPTDGSDLFSGHQFALRYAWRQQDGFELDLMAYYWTQPNAAPGIYLSPGEPAGGASAVPEITLEQELVSSWMAGTALSWQTGAWIFRNEWLWVPDQQVHAFNLPVSTLRDFSVNPQDNLTVLTDFELREDGYLVSKPSLASVFGLEHARWGSTFGLELRTRYVRGVTDDVLAEPFTAAISGYAERSFANERLRLLLLTTFQTAGKDLWNRIEIDYNASDNIRLGTGANFFSGADPKPLFSEVTFQSFRRNSSIYLKATLDL